MDLDDPPAHSLPFRRPQPTLRGSEAPRSVRERPTPAIPAPQAGELRLLLGWAWEQVVLPEASPELSQVTQGTARASTLPALLMPLSSVAGMSTEERPARPGRTGSKRWAEPR